MSNSVQITKEVCATIFLLAVIAFICVQCTFKNPSKDLCIYNAINNKYTPQQIKDICE